ncbi:MAG: terminase, partial [Gammaproteobacteria bacterium]|nr:terminase [Gammaproteobacteria bacterium]
MKKLIALPASPDTARGYSANVFPDEFARHQNSRKIWGALYPVISTGYKLRTASTGNGKANKFYELMSGTDSRWSRHSVDIHQAVADGLPRDIDELREGLNDEDMRAQEYCNEWLDEAGAWLSFDLINSVEHDDAGISSKYMGTPVYIGNDIARRNDLWVAWVWEPVGDVFWTREIVALKRQKFSVHDA